MQKITFGLRLVLGFLFLFSGFMKAIDPLGLAYKIEEYLAMFQLNEWNGLKIPLSIALCTTEMFIGGMLLSGLYKKVMAIVVLVILTVFTVVTCIIYADPFMHITECGCFGELFRLTNEETLWKNAVFLLLAIIYLCLQLRYYEPVRYKVGKGVLSVILVVLCAAVPVYSYVFLPPFDFLPFNIGTDIDNWNATDIRINMYDSRSEDISERVLMREKLPVFMVIAERRMDDRELGRLSVLHDLHRAGKARLLILTSSDKERTGQAFTSGGWGDVDVYYADKVMLKSLIRSRVGVVMLDKGMISGKWALNKPLPKVCATLDSRAVLQKEENIMYIYYLIVMVVVVGWIITMHVVRIE